MSRKIAKSLKMFQNVSKCREMSQNTNLKITFVFFDVVDSNRSVAEFHSVEIVDRQNRASLIFVTNEAESFWSSSFAVANQIYVCNFAELRKNRQNVAFRQFVAHISGVNPRRILIFIIKTD